MLTKVVCITGFAPHKSFLTMKLWLVKLKAFVYLPLMQCNSVPICLAFDTLQCSVTRFWCICLAVCRLLFTSLHSSSTSICTPVFVLHFHWFAPYSDCLLACFGAIYNVFYPKALPNAGHCVAPVFECCGMRKGVPGPFSIFRHAA